MGNTPRDATKMLVAFLLDFSLVDFRTGELYTLL
jgi:hypothetical protein